MTLLLRESPAVSMQAQQSRAPGRRPVPAPALSVVIVNYCQWKNTSQLVEQICHSPHTNAERIEVVVVDNHSPAGLLMHELRRRPGVSLRRWGRNCGFARAVNEGCRLAQGNWLLLLNPDITVNDEFLDGVLRLCTQMDSDPTAGIVGFQLRDANGARQLSWGPLPSLAGTLLRMLLPRAQRKYAFSDTPVRSQVPWVTGCCLLVRRECLAQLAGLDDDYFLYYEDVDLCRRARAQGWSVWFEPRLRAVHHHPLHNRKVPAILRLVTRHSLLTYAKRHWPAWQARLLSHIIQAEAALRRCGAQLRGDGNTAELFWELSALARDLRFGDTDAVRARFRRVLDKHEGELSEFARSSQN